MLSIEKYTNYTDVVIALTIIIAFVIIAKLVYLILEKIVVNLIRKTKTTLDDEILKAIKLPLFFTIIFIGVYIALMQLNLLLEHHQKIQKIFAAIFILIAAIFVTRIVSRVIKWYTVEIALKGQTKFGEQFLPIIKKITVGFIYAIAIMLILGEVFEIEITPLLAGLGIAGLAIALALQDTISNFFAGVYLIADRPIRIGDYIELEGGMRGYVEDIGWRSIRIKTLANNYVIIPNSKLAQSIITNYYLPEEEMSILVPCGVSYHSDLEKVEKITIEVAKEIQQTVPGAIKNFEPFIRYREFGESNINFNVVLRIGKFADQFLVIHEFIKRLMVRYNQEGIEISFPARNIYFKDKQ